MDGRSLPRAIDSAERITALLYELIQALPSLDQVSVQVIRLTVPDADGWSPVAKQSVLPPDLPPGTARALFDIITNARCRFDLWDVY